MDPNLVGDECVDVDIKKLAYDNKVMFHILCNSLTPTNNQILSMASWEMHFWPSLEESGSMFLIFSFAT